MSFTLIVFAKMTLLMIVSLGPVFIVLAMFPAATNQTVSYPGTFELGAAVSSTNLQTLAQTCLHDDRRHQSKLTLRPAH